MSRCCGDVVLRERSRVTSRHAMSRGRGGLSSRDCVSVLSREEENMSSLCTGSEVEDLL